MSSGVLVYSFRTTSKVLVWLLAALVPLQALPHTSCGCEADATHSAVHVVGEQAKCCGCCCQQPSRPPEQTAATHSCCQRADSDTKRTCCDCGANCQCEKGDSTPRPKQSPPEHRSQSTDLTSGPSIVFCLECGDSETMQTEDGKVTSLSGADRCVLLCRFHL